MAKIEKISSAEILDSCGIPTLKTTVYLDDGSIGVASVPSGVSVGTNEALELRDGDSSRYGGKGVLKAIENVQGLIFDAIQGLESTNQQKIDDVMIKLDGTENKSRLGANSILSVSLANAAAAAASQKIPLYQHLHSLFNLLENKKFFMPITMVNLIEGGKHFGQGLDFQEFLVIPKGLKSAKKELDGIEKIIKSLGELLDRNSLDIRLGMEGGFSPILKNNEEAIELLKQAIKEAGFSDQSWAVGLDVAATHFCKEARYKIGDLAKPLSREEFIKFLRGLCRTHSLFSIEDPLEENDWDGWQELSQGLSKDVLIIGDDLTVTNLKRLEKAVSVEAIGGVIVKPNQIGTLTETMNFVVQAKQLGLKIIVSHRAGETEDSFIADLAVAVGADFIKIGSPLQETRLKKYQRLIEVEKDLEKL